MKVAFTAIKAAILDSVKNADFVALPVVNEDLKKFSAALKSSNGVDMLEYLNTGANKSAVVEALATKLDLWDVRCLRELINAFPWTVPEKFHDVQLTVYPDNNMNWQISYLSEE